MKNEYDAVEKEAKCMADATLKMRVPLALSWLLYLVRLARQQAAGIAMRHNGQHEHYAFETGTLCPTFSAGCAWAIRSEILALDKEEDWLDAIFNKHDKQYKLSDEWRAAVRKDIEDEINEKYCKKA